MAESESKFPTKAAEYAARWRKKRAMEWEQAIGDIEFFVDLFGRVTEEGDDVILLDSSIATVTLIEDRLKRWKQRLLQKNSSD